MQTGLDLVGQVITTDALHIQRETAEFVVTGMRAYYVLFMKKSLAGLHSRIKSLPWKQPEARAAAGRSAAS